MKSKALLKITPGFYSLQKKLFQSQNWISGPEQILSPQPNYRQQDLSWFKSEYFSWPQEGCTCLCLPGLCPSILSAITYQPFTSLCPSQKLLWNWQIYLCLKCLKNRHLQIPQETLLRTIHLKKIQTISTIICWETSNNPANPEIARDLLEWI